MKNVVLQEHKSISSDKARQLKAVQNECPLENGLAAGADANLTEMHLRCVGLTVYDVHMNMLLIMQLTMHRRIKPP
jgi:hypothetical protein